MDLNQPQAALTRLPLLSALADTRVAALRVCQAAHGGRRPFLGC